MLAEEYEALHEQLGQLERALEEIRSRRFALYDQARRLRVKRLDCEKLKGDHFRAKIFERIPSAEDLAEREKLSEDIKDVIHEGVEVQNHMHELRHAQNSLVNDVEVRRIHERRRSIELEAELKRLRLIREAIITSKGLERANLRPSAWWFRLVCPDGLWFRETIDTAECYLEPLN